MSIQNPYMTRLLGALVDSLDIPESYYQKAANRYTSLGEWLHRDGSTVADCAPEVYLQGSFQYGTVIRPLSASEEYDLDMACQVTLSKENNTQENVKQMLGVEIQAYAKAQSFNEPAEAKHRCWRLYYADQVNFHVDIVPCIPEDSDTVRTLIQSGVPNHLAEMAVAITDDRHPKYKVIDNVWRSNNPKGFATWFEAKIREVAKPKMMEIAAMRKFASIDEVPSYEWKTPLQRSIQLLKRHRDQMHRTTQDIKPISMIITTLATLAYAGETDLFEALTNILSKMPNFIRTTEPRIPNPLNPKEDFADKWAGDKRQEDAFWKWHTQAKSDLERLSRFPDDVHLIGEVLTKGFAISLSEDIRKCLPSNPKGPSTSLQVLAVAPVLHIRSAPRPWRREG